MVYMLSIKTKKHMMQCVKVVILTHTFPKYPDDTTAAFMHPLVMGLIEAGCEVTVLTPFHPKLELSHFPYPIITYKYIWPDRFHLLGYSQTLQKGMHLRISSYILAPFLMFFGIVALFKLTRDKQYDVISAHWIVPNGVIAAIVGALRTIPFVVTLPGSDVYVARKNAVFSRVTRWAAERAAVVSTDSPQYLKELRETGACLRRQAIIPYPVDSSSIQFNTNVSPLRQRLHIAKGAHIIVSVGRLVEKKGFHYAIRALPGILKKYPSTVYVIVGDGDMRETLEDEVMKFKITKHVHFVGSVTRHEISRYYSLADVIIIPSIKDQQGNIDDRPVALIESMVCGRAVVATRFPGNALTIEHGKSGLLIPQKRSTAIEQAVIELLASKSLRERLGKEAERQAKKKFNHLVIGQKYHNLFRETLTDTHHG